MNPPTFRIVNATLAATSPISSRGPAAARLLLPDNGGDGRQHDKNEDHQQVLDDQPADSEMAALGLHQPPLLQRAGQHDGAGHRQRDAEHQRGAAGPARQPGQPEPEQARRGDLQQRPRDHDGPDRQQILDREMQAHPEHQQDDADLGELQRQVLVGDKARRGRADRDPGEQVSDQRRDPQTMGDRAKDEGEADTEDDRRDQRGRVVLHDAGSILR